MVALGDLAGLFGRGTSGEGCDAVDLRLPGRQEELLEAVLATGTPVVLVLLVGRPYDISAQVDRLAGVVCGFFPGEEGATAIADVLAGRAEPAGRLPVSFPGAGSSQPSTYLAAPLSGRNEVTNIDPTPLFGVRPRTVLHLRRRGPTPPLLSGAAWPTDGCCEIAVPVANTGDRTAYEVVQVYLHDPVAEVARPVQQLIAAARVDLEPGAAPDGDLPAARRPDVVHRPRRVCGSSTRDGSSCGSAPPARTSRSRVTLDLVGARRQVGHDRTMVATVSTTD